MIVASLPRRARRQKEPMPDALVVPRRASPRDGEASRRSSPLELQLEPSGPATRGWVRWSRRRLRRVAVAGGGPAASDDESDAADAEDPEEADDDDDDEGEAALHDDASGRSYSVLEALGAGSFAQCVKLRERGSSSRSGNGGALWAAKLLPKRALSARQAARLGRLDAATKAGLLGVADEIDIHAGLSHPGVVGFEDWFSDRRSGRLAIVLEYCPHGTLRHLLERVRKAPAAAAAAASSPASQGGGTIPLAAAQRWGAQLLAALAYLHERPTLVAHRDLNPNNLLIDAGLNLKLCDFGLACRLRADSSRAPCGGGGGGGNGDARGDDDSGYPAPSRYGVTMTSVGTVNYIAPEVVLGAGSAAPCDLRAADVWSAGVVLHELLFGRVPFDLTHPDTDDEASEASSEAADTTDADTGGGGGGGTDATGGGQYRRDDGGDARGDDAMAAGRGAEGLCAGEAPRPPACAPRDRGALTLPPRAPRDVKAFLSLETSASPSLPCSSSSSSLASSSLSSSSSSSASSLPCPPATPWTTSAPLVRPLDNLGAQSAASLLAAALCRNPALRPSARRLLNHPFFVHGGSTSGEWGGADGWEGGAGVHGNGRVERADNTLVPAPNQPEQPTQPLAIASSPPRTPNAAADRVMLALPPMDALPAPLSILSAARAQRGETHALTAWEDGTGLRVAAIEEGHERGVWPGTAAAAAAAEGRAGTPSLALVPACGGSPMAASAAANTAPVSRLRSVGDRPSAAAALPLAACPPRPLQPPPLDISAAAAAHAPPRAPSPWLLGLSPLGLDRKGSGRCWAHTLSGGDPHGDERWVAAVKAWVDTQRAAFEEMGKRQGGVRGRGRFDSIGSASETEVNTEDRNGPFLAAESTEDEMSSDGEGARHSPEQRSTFEPRSFVWAMDID